LGIDLRAKKRVTQNLQRLGDYTTFWNGVKHMSKTRKITNIDSGNSGCDDRRWTMLVYNHVLLRAYIESIVSSCSAVIVREN